MTAEIIPFARPAAANETRAKAMKFLHDARSVGYSDKQILDAITTVQSREAASNGCYDDQRYEHINRLPFVQTYDSRWGLRPANFWTVTTTGGHPGRSEDSNMARAREYAHLTVEAIRYTSGERQVWGTPSLLGNILRDMLKAEGKAADPKVKARLQNMRKEFFWELGRIIRGDRGSLRTPREA
jgi:hypothetical protein